MKGVTVPDVRTMHVDEAKKQLQMKGLYTVWDGIGDRVAAQSPAPGATLPSGGEVVIYTYHQSPGGAQEMCCVPDVKGLSVVEAARALRARGLDMIMQGSGIASSQSPSADQFVPPGTKVTVQFMLPNDTEE